MVQGMASVQRGGGEEVRPRSVNHIHPVGSQ